MHTTTVVSTLGITGTCRGCGTPYTDPVSAVAIEVDIDLDAGGYGEQGLVITPTAEAWLTCRAPVPDIIDPDELAPCRHRRSLDLDTVLGLALDDLNDRLRRETKEKQ